jgi:SecD/SecF fusion protein
MLLLGTMLSMVTAVLATRAMLAALGGFRWFDNPAFMGASGQKIPAWQKIDFIGKRKLWFGISGAVVVICLASLAIQGLNLGIDFRGGSQATFNTPQPISVEDVRDQAAKLGLSDAIIQGRGAQTDGGYESFTLRTESLDRTEQSDLQVSLERDLGAENFGFKNVSASFSRVILKNALIAVFVSLILISLYVTFRYQFSYAVPVLVALFHDLLISIGVYSLSGREVTASSVAALLTILGYSIYDTIIIFDRVRENTQIMKRSSFAAIANQSLWETIRRSLATTFITLLPVASLLIFGGDTLKDFAFAIFVGVASGAYSTIFIATPLLAVIKEREPEYARRKDAGLADKLDDDDFVLANEPESAPVAPEPVPVPAGASAAPPVDAAARRAARSKRRRGHGRAR